MKKISLLTKNTFHIINIMLIILYLYPGSILGWLIYGNIQKQPQITSDFIFFSSIKKIGAISLIQESSNLQFNIVTFLS